MESRERGQKYMYLSEGEGEGERERERSLQNLPAIVHLCSLL